MLGQVVVIAHHGSITSLCQQKGTDESVWQQTKRQIGLSDEWLQSARERRQIVGPMTVSEIGENEIKVHVSAPVPFPSKGSFEDLRRMPDDLTRVRRWGISQQQADRATVAVCLSHLQADVLRQLELFKPELEYASWEIFKLECLRATKVLLGGGLLNHEFLQMKMRKKESLRGRVRNVAEVLHRSKSNAELNAITGSVFATGVRADVGEGLLAKLDEKALTPNEIIEFAEKKMRKELREEEVRKEVSAVSAELEAELAAMKRGRAEEDDAETPEGKRPRRDKDAKERPQKGPR
ncbi:hypothetical protein FOZ63_014917, partial [Perkinsus olseni]